MFDNLKINQKEGQINEIFFDIQNEKSFGN